MSNGAATLGRPDGFSPSERTLTLQTKVPSLNSHPREMKMNRTSVRNNQEHETAYVVIYRRTDRQTVLCSDNGHSSATKRTKPPRHTTWVSPVTPSERRLTRRMTPCSPLCEV